jgi:hypothetical protein
MYKNFFSIKAPISTSLSTEGADSRTTTNNGGGAVGHNTIYNSNSNMTRTFMFDDDSNEVSGVGGGNGGGDSIAVGNQTNFMELLTYFNQSDSSGVDLNLLEKFNRVLFQRPGSRALSVPSFFPIANQNHYSTSNLLNKPSARRNRPDHPKSGLGKGSAK